MNRIFVLICILFYSFLTVKAQSNTEQRVVPQSQLKILSWNIYMLPYISLFNGNGNRAKMIVDELKTSDYQIIVFQEAFSSHCRGIISKGLKERYPYQYGPANINYIPLRTNSGLWVLSKIPLTKIGQIVFRQSSGYDKIARKGAVMFEGEYNHTTFQLLATHLQADNPDQLRAEQCAEIKQKLLTPNSKNKVPQIICGDFNIDFDDQSNYRNMLTTLDAENGDISGQVHTTYDEVNNNLARIPNGKMRIIDYILIRDSQHLETIERKIHPFFNSVGNEHHFLSDHYAMEASINFRSVDLESFAQVVK